MFIYDINSREILNVYGHAKIEYNRLLPGSSGCAFSSVM